MPELSPTEIDESFAPSRSRDAYTVEIDGEAVLLDERENRLHLLNHTAALVWACFDGHTAVRDLVVEISEELDTPYDVVLVDVLAIARHFGDEGLLDGVRRSATDTGSS